MEPVVSSPDFEPECFALLRVEQAGQERVYFLGPRTSITPRRSVIDWRTAPLAQVFFRCDEGEEFELEVAGRIVSGRVLEKKLFGVGERAPILKRVPKKAGRFELDASQRRAVERDERALLVLGEAGFGKTTVALHRVARLESEAAAAGRRFRAIVIVPTPGLEKLSRILLDRLGAARVEVSTYDDFVLRQARRVFRGLPAKDSVGATAGIIRIKRHPALRRELAEISALAETKARRSDLLMLLGDRDRLERVRAASGGVVSSHAIDELIEHTKLQFSRTTENESKHIDPDRLVTLDGLSIDDGTPLEDAESIDAEDGAILFEIHRSRKGSGAALKKYDHLVIDEAQELAPIELAFLGSIVARGGSLTVAGDEHQQIDDTACFPGWASAMRELGAEGHASVRLTESHRCPPEVTRWARSLFDNSRPRSPTSTSGPLALTLHPHACAKKAALVEELRSLERSSPSARIAIIAMSSASARQIQRDLEGVIGTRLALGGDFDFLPGVVVTSVEEVKGLEFDVVILPDLGRELPRDLGAKKATYVAATRALRQLWIPALGRTQSATNEKPTTR
jgi:DNA helicase IV